MSPINTQYGNRNYIPYKDKNMMSPDRPMIVSSARYRELKEESEKKTTELWGLVDKKLSESTFNFNDLGRIEALLTDKDKFENVHVLIDEADDFSLILNSNLNFPSKIPKG